MLRIRTIEYFFRQRKASNSIRASGQKSEKIDSGTDWEDEENDKSDQSNACAKQRTKHKTVLVRWCKQICL